jgi:hypothetical protein
VSMIVNIILILSTSFPSYRCIWMSVLWA